MWVERVEKETDGAVKIERIGPEAIPVYSGEQKR